MENNFYNERREIAMRLFDEMEIVNNSDMANKDKVTKLNSLWMRYASLDFVAVNDGEFNIRMSQLKLPSDGPYILEQGPNMESLDEDEIIASVARLEEVLQARREGINVGIDEKDANNILKWTVLNARKDYNNRDNVLTNSLLGLCGYGQAITMIPLQQLGLDVTINNAFSSFSADIKHAFGTVIFPINASLENGEKTVVNRQYIVDTTYRQFFLAARCNEWAYHEADSRFKGKVAPDPGYFIVQSASGKELATDLLRDGFVPLSEESVKLYGDSFVSAGFGLDRHHLLDYKLKGNTGRNYINGILNNQEELDYSVPELIGYGANLKFPSRGEVRSSEIK